MLVTEFSDTCQKYSGFQIWEIESLSEFFAGNTILATIFEDTYKFPIEELNEKRELIVENDLHIITKMLSQVDDKYFHVFTLHDESHVELIKMQQLKIMDFGVNITQVRQDRVYAVIMDKNLTQSHYN